MIHVFSSLRRGQIHYPSSFYSTIYLILKKIKQVCMHSYHFSSIYQVPIPLLSMICALSKLAFVTYCELGIIFFLSSQIRKWRMKELK